jgi:hypothetical protein
VIETKAAFARRIGINKSNVTRAAQAGRIVLTPGGMVNVEASVQRWYETKGGRDDVAARHAENRGAAGSVAGAKAENGTAGPKPATAAQPAGEGNATAGGGETRTRYKAVAMQYENQSIKLEMALRRGLRYPIALVKRESLGIGSSLRAAVERVIDQCAPRLAVMTNDLDRRRLLDAELRRLRWMVKSEIPRALRRMRPVGMPVAKPAATRYHGEIVASPSAEKRAVSNWGAQDAEEVGAGGTAE